MSDPLYRSRPTAFEMLPATTVRNGPVNEFIYLSEGNSNAFLIVTSEGRIVINTGMGFEAPMHKAYFDSIDSGPVRYVIFTQGHVDHVGGSDLFVEDGTELVAHAHNPAHQAEDALIAGIRARRSYFAFADSIQRANAYVKEKLGGVVSGQARPVPTITFDERFAFMLGGLEVELISTPGAETKDSLVVWLPQHGICFTGNVFGALFGHFPNLVTVRGDRYRDALTYVATLEKIQALDPEMLCVGHHEPVRGRELIRRELSRMREAVLFVHDATVKGMNEGKDVYTLMREIELPPELEVGEGYGKVSWSVRAIWENYVGWFHHHSTTELYSTPPWSVSPDLCELAGGPDIIAEAARKKLASGAAVEAIHLAEVALAADRHHAAATDASLEAHRMLLAQASNFWEHRWLEKQIARLQRNAGGAS
ncbi:MAG: MBL fold metallo-hydrolase [bacterium]|nr:MBL fold metallo-hydrolase [bacterium]